MKGGYSYEKNVLYTCFFIDCRWCINNEYSIIIMVSLPAKGAKEFYKVKKRAIKALFFCQN